MTRRLRPAGVVLALLLIGSFGAAAPPEKCPSVTPAALERSAQAAVDWFVRNQSPDGTWLYQYKRANDSALDDYNVVRHTGGTMGLYLAHLEGLPRALASADRGAAWALDRLRERGDWAAVEYEGQVRTGTTALFVAGLVLRREATGQARHDALLRRMGRFLVGQTESSGAVLEAYDPVKEAPIPDQYSKYFTGEAYWALALLHRSFPDEEWGEVADRVGAYLATERDDREDHWPPIPDHWAGYGLAETVRFPERDHRRPLTGDEADYARSQASLFGAGVRWIAAQFGPWGELARGTDVPRGGGYGVVSEALTGLWLAAQADARLADERQPIAERASCIAGLAIKAQSDAGDARQFARPDRVEGAWFIDGETRMDDQQHALAGLLRTIPIVRADHDSSDGPGSGWLWILALLLALNPIRAASAVPRVDRSRREVAELAAMGGAIGGLAVCVVAVIADPVLDVADVSNEAFRIAAGLVAVLTGLTDLFRRPPSSEPVLEGRRAALAPLAFPVVARPALVVMALGAGGDHSVLVTATAMVLGVALLAGVAARWDPHERRLRWAARLLAAGLVACGVFLTLDGIFDV